MNRQAEMDSQSHAAVVASRQAASTPAGPARSTTAAVLLSLLFVGLGHVYAGNAVRGLVWLGGGLLLTIFTAGIAAPFVYIGAAIDAANVAKSATR